MTTLPLPASGPHYPRRDPCPPLLVLAIALLAAGCLIAAGMAW